MANIILVPGTTRTQAGATLIGEDMVLVNTSTAPAAGSLLGDGLVMQAIGSGSARCIIVNNTANPIQIYGNGSDTINGVAGATGIAMPPNSIDLFVEVAPGAWQVEAGVGTAGQLCTMLALDGIAAAGSAQGTATVLSADFNRVTSSTPASAFGVQLPAAKQGLDVFVLNHSGNAIQVYGNGSDTVDDLAGSTGVNQMNNSVVLYTCYANGAWYTEGLATGFSASLGLQTQKAAVIAASATDTQVGGTPITALINHVTSTGASQACTLPTATPGLAIMVVLATAANAVDIFPASGDAINALGANTKLTMGALTSTTFACAVAGQWFTSPRVPS